ncbi:MAG: hypothetical protein ACRCSN_07220 [Dermatophilaceae bacterium]
MQGSRVLGVALVVGVVGAGLGAPSARSSADPPPETGVPVLGQARVGAVGQGQERPPTMVVSVHGLRRTTGATVLYYSIGFAGDAPDPANLPVTDYGTGPDTFGTLQASAGAGFTDTAAAIDVPGRRSYGALRSAGGHAVAAPAPTGEQDRLRLTDRAVVQWIALAPIPATVRVVDVLVGSVFVRGIPVGNGLLEPVVDEAAPAAGSGWPRVDTAAIGAARADGTVKTLVTTIAKVPPGPAPSPSSTRSPSPSSPPSAAPSASG